MCTLKKNSNQISTLITDLDRGQLQQQRQKSIYNTLICLLQIIKIKLWVVSLNYDLVFDLTKFLELKLELEDGHYLSRMYSTNLVLFAQIPEPIAWKSMKRSIQDAVFTDFAHKIHARAKMTLGKNSIRASSYNKILHQSQQPMQKFVFLFVSSEMMPESFL